MNSSTHSPPPPPTPAAAAFDSIALTLAELFAVADDDYAWDPPRRFTSYARRLQLLAQQLAALADLGSPAAITALRGIASDLEASRAALSTYHRPSRILVLINCVPLCASLRSHASSIASSLALIDSALSPLPDLRKKAADLSHDLLQSDLRVTDMEERVYRTLQKEAEVRAINKAVQSAIIMDVARALGVDPCDHAKLSEHIRQLRSDLSGLSSVAERKILMSLEKIMDSWSTEHCFATDSPDADFEENAQMPPFKSFICPLTKEVMKDPVVLESSQTYDRSAIEIWFERCRDDGRVPTCPMTGQELLTMDLKRNIGLAGAIEEWVNRNIEAQIKVALQCLGERGLNSEESVEKVLDSVYGISEEHPEFRYRIRNAGIVYLVMRMLKEQSKKMGPHLRWKALMAMHSMARDEESKLIMLKEGITRLAIRCLSETSEKEKEYALRILLHFSYDEEFSSKLAQEKGALYLLTSIVGNSDQPTLSNLAEDILRNMERIEGNIEYLATEGRYHPLLKRLCEGAEDDRMEMAKLLGKINLSNSGKEYIARKGGKVLVCMLSSKIDGTAESLEALYNLSSFSDNAAVLVGQGLLPALVDILLSKQLVVSSNLKELAAQIIARIVANPGHWETSFADNEGHEMLSEFMIHELLGVLDGGSCKYKAAILHILGGITTSPKASQLAATHIKSGNGIKAIVQYIDDSEDTCRAHAFRLISLLSEKLGIDLFEELRASGKLPFLKERLLDSQCPSGMKTDIVCILSNLPFSDDEVKNILGPDLLTWAVNNHKMQRSYSTGKRSKDDRSPIEGLLGLLLHYARSHDPNILPLIQETHLLSIFREQLGNHSNCSAKQRGSLGLKYLSESATLSTMIRDSDPQPPSGFCAPFIFLCGKSQMGPVPCSLHNTVCGEDSSFCLLKGNAINPLIDLMEDNSVEVQIAAVEALSTLVSDICNLKRSAVEILNDLGLCKAVVSLVKEVGSRGLQERVVFMVDKFLQVKSLSEQYSMDPDLVKALVEALKNGNANTKRYAQNALQNLNKISGIGGRSST